jgi:hypothetical protein
MGFFIWPLCYLYLCFWAFSFGHCVICICVLGLFHLAIVLSVFVFWGFFIWPLCYLYLCFRSIYFASFYYFSIAIWNWSDSVVIFYFSFYLDLKTYHYVITPSILWNHRRSQKGIEMILVIQSLILVKEALIGWTKEIYSTDFERDENGFLENAHFL